MAGTRPPFYRFFDWMERFRGREVVFRGVEDEQQMWPVAVRPFFRSRGEDPGPADEQVLADFRAMKQACSQISAERRCCSLSTSRRMNGSGLPWPNTMDCPRDCSTGLAVPLSRCILPRPEARRATAGSTVMIGGPWAPMSGLSIPPRTRALRSPLKERSRASLRPSSASAWPINRRCSPSKAIRSGTFMRLQRLSCIGSTLRHPTAGKF
jgi:hypothetical protein